MNPVTPTRRPLNKHLAAAGGAGPVAQDSPLGDMSNAAGAGAGGAGAASKASRLKLSKKEGLQSLPAAGTSDISITRDWEGPEGKSTAAAARTKPSGLGPRADRFITQSRGGGLPLLDDGGGDTLSSAGHSSGDESQIAANIAAAQMNPNEVAPNTDSLEAACNVDINQRILSYSAAPPNSANPDIRSRYAAARPKTVPSSLLSGGRRKIPTEAEKVLDAPGMINDFYYHLIDWSSTNLVAVALQSVVHVWNGDTGEVDTLCDLEMEPERVGGGGMVTSVRWDCDGAYLSIGTDRGYVQLWDVASAQRVRTLKPSIDGGADNASVNISAWAPDGTFSCGYASGLIREHDVRERDSVLRDLPGAHVGHVSGLEWRADSALLASGGNDNVVKVWDRRTNVAKMRKENHQASVKAMAWCPWNSSVLATGGGTADRAIHFWNVTSGTRTQSIQTDSQITGLHWSTHYREIVSTHGNHMTDHAAGGTINLWSHPACSRIAEIKNAHDGRILHTALSPDGQILATVGTDENLKFWRVFAGREEGAGAKGGAAAGSGAAASQAGKSGGGGRGGAGGAGGGRTMLR